MLITQEQIFNEIQSLRKMVEEIKQDVTDFNLESISVGKAAKLLHVGDDTIKKLIRTKHLQSFKVNGTTRIKLSEIKRFQNSEEHSRIFLTENAETAEDIAKRIFGNKERKAS